MNFPRNRGNYLAGLFHVTWLKIHSHPRALFEK